MTPGLTLSEGKFALGAISFLSVLSSLIICEIVRLEPIEEFVLLFLSFGTLLLLGAYWFIFLIDAIDDYDT